MDRISPYTEIPQFVFRKQHYVWHRMDSEEPNEDKEVLLKRKKWLVEEHGRTGFRIIKHKDKYYLYERKY